MTAEARLGAEVFGYPPTRVFCPKSVHYVTISVYRLSRGFLRVSGGAGRGMGRDSRVAGETGCRVAITIHFTRTKERRKPARRQKGTAALGIVRRAHGWKSERRPSVRPLRVRVQRKGRPLGWPVVVRVILFGS